jgi:hypothetical protein
MFVGYHRAIKTMIDKIWCGNGWTPAEVIEEIKRHGE